MLGRPDGRGGWLDVTAAEFRDEVLAVAKGLLAQGIRFGDRVAIMSRTRYEWTLFDFALWTIGAQPVPVYPTSSTTGRPPPRCCGTAGWPPVTSAPSTRTAI
ncbi:AMP-binding protein [Streptomyces sp.]|uniref:AMP-binding protein n=1 Tax=Streptomyces sp. TaxID=1931 RepID=UPI0039C9EE9F